MQLFNFIIVRSFKPFEKLVDLYELNQNFKVSEVRLV
jgi:hypothetical protein